MREDFDFLTPEVVRDRLSQARERNSKYSFFSPSWMVYDIGNFSRVLSTSSIRVVEDFARSYDLIIQDTRGMSGERAKKFLKHSGNKILPFGFANNGLFGRFPFSELDVYGLGFDQHTWDVCMIDEEPIGSRLPNL